MVAVQEQAFLPLLRPLDQTKRTLKSYLMEKTKKNQAMTAYFVLLSFLSAVTTPAAHAEVLPAATAGTATPTTPGLMEEQAETATAPQLVDDPRETFVLLAVLCFNEASGNELDCKAIGNIRRRYARSQGITLREALLALHTERRARSPESAALRTYRATRPNPEDPRPWLGDVRSDLHQPLGWTGTATEWARTARVFQQLYLLAQGIEAGAIGDTCEGQPIGWAGPRVDAESLSRLAAQGRRLVHCHGTANVYYDRMPRPVTPQNPAAIGD